MSTRLSFDEFDEKYHSHNRESHISGQEIIF